MGTHSSHQAPSWARCLNLRGWLELDTIFCTFAFSTFLLTILKHLLTQHVPLPRHLHHCVPPLGHQGTQHLDSGLPFVARRSRASQALEAYFPLGLHLLFLLPLVPYGFPPLPVSTPAILSDGQAAVAHHCSCADQPGSKTHLCYDCFHQEKAGFPAVCWWRHSFGALILTSYCFSPYIQQFKTSKPLTLAKFSWINQQMQKLLGSNA